MYCSQCGQTLAEENNFCPACGSKVVHSDETSQNTETPQEWTSVNTEAPDQNEEYDNAEGEESRAGFICSIVGAVILPLIFGTIGLVLSYRESKKGYYSGFIKAGIIVGIIDIVWGVLALLLWLARLR